MLVIVLTVAPQLADAASPNIWLMFVDDCVPPKVTVKLPLLPVTLTLSMPMNASRADLRLAAVIDVASASTQFNFGISRRALAPGLLGRNRTLTRSG